MNEEDSADKKTISHHMTIEVPSDLRGYHPLISQTRRAIEKQRPDEKLLLQSIDKGILSIRVTRNSLQRALRIMEAIINAAESRGWIVRPRNERGGCAIVIGEDEVGVHIREKINRSEIPPEKPTEGWYWKRYRYGATGLLTFEITDYLGDSMRHSWSDGKRQRLEDVLKDFVVGIAAAAEAQRMADRLDPFRNDYFSQRLAESEFESELDCQPRRFW